MSKNEKPLILNDVFENGTRYTADSTEIHVHEEDCTKYWNRMQKESSELNVAFHLKDLDDVEMDFRGATLVLHGKIQPFLLENCRNVTVRNISIVYERPSFTEMTVTEIGADFMRVRLNPGHPCRIEDGRMIPYCREWENTGLDRMCMFLQPFDSKTRDGMGLVLCIIGKEVVPDLPASFNPVQLVAEDGGDGTVILRGRINPCYKVGATLALGHEKRNYSSALMLDCCNVRLDSYRVMNGAGMGVMPIHSKDISLNKVVFMPGDNAVISNQADAVHALACSGRFEISDCVFEGMMDDALNIHSQFFILEKCDGRNMVLLAQIHGGTAHIPIFGPGDVIGVHRGITTEVVDEYTIENVTLIDDDRIGLTLDRTAADGLELRSLVENLSAQADITIRNCVFQHANTHLRFQSSGRIRVENCRIALPVLLTGDASFWYESSAVTDMEFKDTAFLTERGVVSVNPQVMPAEGNPYFHRNIRFVNCSFDSVTPLDANMADDIVFQETHNSKGKTMTLSLVNCGKVTAPGCTLLRKTEKKLSVSIN